MPVTKEELIPKEGLTRVFEQIDAILRQDWDGRQAVWIPYDDLHTTLSDRALLLRLKAAYPDWTVTLDHLGASLQDQTFGRPNFKFQ